MGIPLTFQVTVLLEVVFSSSFQQKLFLSFRTKVTEFFNQTFQHQYAGFEVVLAGCLFLLFKQNCNKPSKLLKHIPIIPLALPIYLMHNILLSMMGYVFNVTNLWDTLSITALNFAICFITMKTVATIKPICYLATGMSYEDACKSCNWVYTFNKLKKTK